MTSAIITLVPELANNPVLLGPNDEFVASGSVADLVKLGEGQGWVVDFDHGIDIPVDEAMTAAKEAMQTQRHDLANALARLSRDVRNGKISVFGFASVGDLGQTVARGQSIMPALLAVAEEVEDSESVHVLGDLAKRRDEIEDGWRE